MPSKKNGVWLRGCDADVPSQWTGRKTHQVHQISKDFPGKKDIFLCLKEGESVNEALNSLGEEVGDKLQAKQGVILRGNTREKGECAKIDLHSTSTEPLPSEVIKNAVKLYVERSGLGPVGRHHVVKGPLGSCCHSIMFSVPESMSYLFSCSDPLIDTVEVSETGSGVKVYASTVQLAMKDKYYPPCENKKKNKSKKRQRERLDACIVPVVCGGSFQDSPSPFAGVVSLPPVCQEVDFPVDYYSIGGGGAFDPLQY
eukprot:TRINITY_DN7172_c1_g1_i1.p1 TRINITY_DN7172_c1_g1~~TRINITY_DN7172_c1_g1_i1.p1  ORF type:complete len:256 (+),score=27.72 TRINITY_DN7172_c1_g1_i1:40-807(+)